MKSQSREDAPRRDTSRPTFHRDEHRYVPYVASGHNWGEGRFAGRTRTHGSNFTTSKKEILGDC